MDLFTLVNYVLVAVALSLAVGAYAIVPPLVLGVATLLGIVHHAPTAWLAHPGVLLILSVALAAEIALDLKWPLSNAVAPAGTVIKPAVAASLATSLLGPEIGALVSAIALGALPAWITQLPTLAMKWSIRLDPVTNLVCAAAGLLASGVIAVWAVAIFPQGPLEEHAQRPSFLPTASIQGGSVSNSHVKAN